MDRKEVDFQPYQIKMNYQVYKEEGKNDLLNIINGDLPLEE